MSMPSDQPVGMGELAAALRQPWVQKIAAGLARPGDPRITSQAAAQAGVSSGSRVLIACGGRGSHAVHLAGAIGCRVSAPITDPDGLPSAREEARRENVAHLVSFFQGEQGTTRAWPESDAVILECVLSSLEKRQEMVAAAAMSLAPGGSLVILDVSAETPLPEQAREFLAAIGFSRQVPSMPEYAAMARGAGLSPGLPQAFPHVLPAYLRGLAGKMGAAGFAVSLGLLPISPRVFSQIKEMLAVAQGLADEGTLQFFVLQTGKAATTES